MLGWIRIRIQMLGWIRIRIQMLGWIRIRIQMLGWIRIRIRMLGWIRIQHHLHTLVNYAREPCSQVINEIIFLNNFLNFT